MKDINYVTKELKEISNNLGSNEIKERLGKTIKVLNIVQAYIYEQLCSFDVYSEGRDEIAGIIDELLDKIDSVQYDIDNSWRMH